MSTRARLSRRNSLGSILLENYGTSHNKTVARVEFCYEQDISLGNGQLLDSTHIVDRLLPELNTEYVYNELSMRKVEEEEIRCILEIDVADLDYTTAILARVSDLSDNLENLKVSLGGIDETLTTFKQASGVLKGDAHRLRSLADGIGERLRVYDSLGNITRVLHGTRTDIVVNPRFKTILSDIERGIEMTSDPSIRDAETYQTRFRQCMTRALTLVRVHFCTVVKDTASDVSTRLAAGNMNETSRSVLLYTKFKSPALTLKPLLNEIRTRAHSNAEYSALIEECHAAFMSARVKLVKPIVSSHIEQLSTDKKLVSFARHALNYTRGVCAEEASLYLEFFPELSDKFTEYIQTLCEPLYYSLRGRIIQEPDFLNLCELCSLIRLHYVNSDRGEEQTTQTRPEFSRAVEPILHDAETRLIYWTQNLVTRDIEQFSPNHEDLDYPNILNESQHGRPKAAPLPSNHTDAQARAEAIASKSTAQGAESDELDTYEVYAGWYPTLRTTIWILSRIYRLVNSNVFDDLTHTLVHSCIGSLVSAHDKIRLSASEVDGKLFLIKHLLVLKEQIAAFDIVYIRSEAVFDFSGIVEILRQIRSEGFAGTLSRLAQSRFPRVVESMVDAKEELDDRLRLAINQLTAEPTNKLASMIVSGAKIGQDAVKVRNLARQFREHAASLLLELQKKSDLYIRDKRTTDILVNAVREQVFQAYESFYHDCESNYRSTAAEIDDTHTLSVFIDKKLLQEEEEEEEAATATEQIEEET